MKDSSEPPVQLGWHQLIAQRVRDSDVERQLLHSRARRIDTSAWLARFLPGDAANLLGEFLKTLLGSVIGIWGLTWLLRWACDLDGTLTYAGFGLLFSLQASYYKLRLMRDPSFRIPKCRCAGRKHDNSEAVLGNRSSNVVGVPIAALAAVLYVAIVALWFGHQPTARIVLTVAALSFSAYLAFLMIARIRDLCFTCINITAVNLLLTWSLL
jgi:uncharacterized membrane protein